MKRRLALLGRSALAGVLLTTLVAIPQVSAAGTARVVPVSERIGKTISSFAMSVIVSKHERAHRFLTPTFHAQIQRVPLDRLLGIGVHPNRFTYAITNTSSTRAGVRLNFHFPAGTARLVKNLTVLGANGRWLIDGIAPVGQFRPDAQMSNGPLIQIGKSADNLWPLTISIFGDGRVTGFWTAGAQGAKGAPNVHLSKHAVAGLVTLARAEGFFSMAPRIGAGPANAAGRFVTIRTSSGTRTVSGRGLIQSAAFNQLCAVVLAAAGVPCNPARQCGV